jgi:hypothetical protein
LKEYVKETADWITNHYSTAFQFIANRPLLGYWLAQLARIVGFALGLFGGYSVIIRSASELGKYELAYQIAGKVLLTGSSITFVGILAFFIILVLVTFKV